MAGVAIRHAQLTALLVTYLVLKAPAAMSLPMYRTTLAMPLDRHVTAQAHAN
jgi:hypothetical protein